MTRADEGSEQLSAVERYKRAKEARKTAPPMRLPSLTPLVEDTLWRGLSRGGEVRVMLVRSTNAVTEASSKLECGPEAALFLAELMTAVPLLKACLNPDEQLQLSAQHTGSLGNFVIDCYATGEMRATVRHPEADVGLLGEGTVQIARIIRHRGTYTSSIGLCGDRPADLIMRYLLESEQIVTYLNVEVDVDPQTAQVRHAVGVLVQLMPEGTKEQIQTIVDNLAGLPSLCAAMTDEDPDAMAWAERLMQGMFWDQVARQTVAYHCPCSPERVVALISSLPRADIEELASDDAPLETTCDYCRTTYAVPVAQIRHLLAEPS